ncbi:MAG TPA: hypothetical protein VLV49_05225 [Terriglobales bacterium]|nr:hypothetical protein [Terriglobales bacterium]
MNCAEFERLLPEMLEGAGTAALQSHLRTCRACAELASDLEAISQQARFLRASEEPSPRVWNSIEVALRQEGLIHEPHPVAEPRNRWRWSPLWLLPTAAALMFAFGIVKYREMPVQGPSVVAQQTLSASAPAAPVVTVSSRTHPAVEMPADDLQLLQAVGARSPALRAMYAADLQNINEYIRDAEASAQDNPNDEEVQRYLVNAYEQKTMVYQMALDRSLP